MTQPVLPFLDLPVIGPRQRRVGARIRPRPAPRKAIDHRIAALADPRRVVFLDIETTGLSWFYDEITLIGWAIGGVYQALLPGEDLAELKEALRTAAALVTFNGTLFDLRFLRSAIPDLILPEVHIDLRYLARRVGLVGGQKSIERQLRMPTRSDVGQLDGQHAVLLWHQFVRGDADALNTLMSYNRWDIVGMCGILDEVVARLDPHPDLLAARQATTFLDDALSMAVPQRVKPTTAASRRSWTFEQLFADTAAADATVVGIDLRGSESRPSGLSILRGPIATCELVSTDDEIVARVIEARPRLVSIDSPLSLPTGRTRVEDDDPSRSEFGIMRRSERELKRRGINVYPCLLPSMQGLTRRGMSLAERLRAMGMPVIESYPGAAQDIMRIPRKGAGVEFLRQGLLEFGIKGQLETAQHDELDAVTSAIVGFFFLADKYEALGGYSEGALIIPDLETVPPTGMVVGISGRICAGKTTAARFLERQGFAYTRFSMIVDEVIASRGLPLDRETRQRVGFELHQTKGQSWLCERVIERVSQSPLIVIDGMRFPEDHAFFIERFGARFVHLHIEAPQEVRASRYPESGEDAVPFQVADHQPVESGVDDLRRLAAAVISNISAKAALYGALTEILRKQPLEGVDRWLFR